MSRFFRLFVGVVCASALSGACSGDKGDTGPAGPAGTGAPGAPGTAGPPGMIGTLPDGGTSAEGGGGRGNVDHLELPGPAFFPESLSAAADGSIFVGSVGLGAVAKFAPGSVTPTFFIAPGGAVKNVTGVLVDDVGGLLYVCAIDFAAMPPSTLGVRSYKLSDGTFQTNYAFPGLGFCNDMAFDAARNLYVADSYGKIYKLAKGGAALTVWSSDPLLAASSPTGFGADGIVVDGSNVYVNTFTDARLLRIPIKGDGTADAATQLTVTPALASTDGMRLVSANTLMVVEGTTPGRLTKVTITGDTATATPIANRLEAPTSVVKSGDSWWVTEGQLGYLLGQPGSPNLPFYVRRILAQP